MTWYFETRNSAIEPDAQGRRGEGGAEDSAALQGEYLHRRVRKDNTFEEFKDLDVNVIGKGIHLQALPYGRVSQGLNYGLSFYNLKLKEDYDVINAHMAPSHWIRNRNERVLWYVHTPFRDVYDLYEFRHAAEEVLPEAGALGGHTRSKKHGPEDREAHRGHTREQRKHTLKDGEVLRQRGHDCAQRRNRV